MIGVERRTGVYWDMEMTEEEEEKVIRSVAKKIHQHGMEVAAIFMMESVKPLTFIGTQIGRFFLSPFLPTFGDNISIAGEKLFYVFEKHKNMEKLLTVLEELAKEEPEPKKVVETTVTESDEAPQKRGWRRFLSF